MTRTSYLALSECTCASHSREEREKLEVTLIGAIEERFPASDETKALNFVSMGAGELLQCFIIMVRLLDKGYKNINLFTIEPSGIDTLARNQFGALSDMALELGAVINITHLCTVEGFKSRFPNTSIDVVSCIDYEDIFRDTEGAFGDVLKVQELLSNNGVMLFDYNSNQLLLSKDALLSAVIEKGLQEELLELASCNEALPESDTINIALLEGRFALEEWVCFLPKLLDEKQYLRVNVTLIQPAKRNDEGAVLDVPNSAMNQANLTKFLQLCLGPSRKVLVKVVASRTEFLEQHSGEQNDVITCLGGLSCNLDELYGELEAINGVSPEAGKYLMVQFVIDGLNLEVAHGGSDSIVERSEFEKQVHLKQHVTERLEILFQKFTSMFESANALASESENRPLTVTYNEDGVKKLFAKLGQIDKKIFHEIKKPGVVSLDNLISVIFFDRVENQSSVMDLLASCNPANRSLSWQTPDYQKEMIAFVKKKFSVDLNESTASESHQAVQ